MARTNFFGPLTSVLFLALAPLGAACNGHVISLGNTGDTLQPISGGVAAAAATPVACPTGWAHPNICCTATANSSPACGAWEENPFRACEAGATTYPDPLSCCSLADPTNCSDVPSGPVATPPPSYGCGYVCPPGWWSQEGAATPVSDAQPVCCESQAGGVPLCVAQANGVTLSTPVGTCGGSSSGATTGAGSSSSGGNPGSGSPSSGGNPTSPGSGSSSSGGSPTNPPPEDAGISEDAACGTPVGTDPDPYDGGAASLCGACPTGWSADTAQPELCCQTDAEGTRLCFSQASGSATSTDFDAGVGTSGNSSPPSSGWGSGGAAPDDGGPSLIPDCSGSDTSCSCNLTLSGHTYALECTVASNGAVSCNCLTDGVSTRAVSVDSCQDSTAVTNAFTDPAACGYP